MISSNFKYYYFIGFLTIICLIFFANSILLFLLSFCSSIRFSRYALFNFGASSKLILTILISYSLLIYQCSWLAYLTPSAFSTLYFNGTSNLFAHRNFWKLLSVLFRPTLLLLCSCRFLSFCIDELVEMACLLWIVELYGLLTSLNTHKLINLTLGSVERTSSWATGVILSHYLMLCMS